MERRPYYKQNNSGISLGLAFAVSMAAALGYFKSQDSDLTPSPQTTDVVPLETAPEYSPSPVSTETPVPTLNGIPLPIQVYPPVTPTREVPDLIATLAAHNR